MTAPIYLELCRSNSLGNHYCEPTVIEQFTTATAEEAVEQLSSVRPNGLFVRIEPPGLTREDQERFRQNKLRVNAVLCGNEDSL